MKRGNDQLVHSADGIIRDAHSDFRWGLVERDITVRCKDQS